MANPYPSETSLGMRSIPSPNRSRKRTSQACLPCSRRKTKCDGATPACWQCQTNDRECLYGFSRRNKRQKCNVETLEIVEEVDLSLQQPHPEGARRQPSIPLLRDPSGDVALENSQTGPSNARPRQNPLPSLQGDGCLTSTADGLVSVATSKRLLHAYFSYIHPVWPIIYKPLYDFVDHESMADLLPRQVLYAMFAIAASLPVDSSAAEKVETPSPALFFEKALQTMQCAADNHTISPPNSFSLHWLMRPSLENCQTLTLLALQQHGCAEASRAYMLLNMAIAMSIELRLDRVNICDEDAISTQVKSRVWWNLFILEKMIAAELSRPLTLRLEDTGTPLPSVHESDEYQLLQFKLPNMGSTVSTKAYTISGFHTTIQMANIMEKIYREIYSFTNRENIRKNPQTGEKSRMNLWQEIKDLQALLAASKGAQGVDILSSSAIPLFLLTNTVWTSTATIILHRPFWFKWHDQNPDWQSPPKKSDPLEVSFAAAEDICQIVEAHVNNLQRFPCDLVFPILTAASTLSHYRHADPSVAQEKHISHRLAMCLNWLSILGRNWKHAINPKLSNYLGISQTLTSSSSSSSHLDVEPASIDYPAYDVQPEYLQPNLVAGEGPRRDNIQGLECLSSRNDRVFHDMLGDVEDEFCATNPEFRDFFELWSRNEFA